MRQEKHRSSSSTSDRLHPHVYTALAGTAVWFALAAWSFASDGYSEYLMVIVSAFAIVAVTIPYVLWRTGRRHGRGPDAGPDDRSFSDWASGEFATWQDRTKGANAAIEVLLPMTAIAIGMTAIGIVFMLTAHAG